MRFTSFVVFAVAAIGCEGPEGPAGGDGASSLVATNDEPPGANCGYGGTRVDVGLDDDGDGILDPGEITRTAYVCNAEGTNALIETTIEPAGTNCPFGGTKIETGNDKNNDDVLDSAEVDGAATTYVCA